jgi:hypothetical protein
LIYSRSRGPRPLQKKRPGFPGRFVLFAFSMILSENQFPLFRIKL